MKQDIENIIKKCKRCSLPQSEWKGRWEKPLCKVEETTYEQHILEETESKSIKEQLEQVIKKNLPEKKGEVSWLNEDATGGYNIALDEINTSLIADEVLKVVMEKIARLCLNKHDEFMEEVWRKYDGSKTCGEVWVEYIKTNSSTLEGERSEHLSPNKENKNND